MKRLQRTWNNPRNAVGFAAACARLALPFYEGKHRSNVVSAIELSERYASGEDISAAEFRAAPTAAAAAYAAYAAAYAAHAAHAAYAAGVLSTDLARAYATWVVRDLIDRELDPETEHAVFAAVLAGHEDVAEGLIEQWA